jgi:hypothetical protein
VPPFDAADQPAHLTIARKWMNEWLAVKHNKIAGSLSRDTHLEPLIHSHLLLAHFPSHQIPAGFHIAPLPNAITLWINSILHNLPVTRELCQKVKNNRTRDWNQWLAHLAINQRSDAPSSPTLISSPTSNLSSLGDLLKPFDLVSCSSTERRAWLAKECAVTSTNWYRPFGIIDTRIQYSTLMAPFLQFYRGKLPVTGMWIQPQSDRRQSVSKF